jgi:hypothetical protein
VKIAQIYPVKNPGKVIQFCWVYVADFGYDFLGWFLASLEQPELTVDAESIPDWYSGILSMPWQRFYTLNIDDLPVAATRKFRLPRNILPISATNPGSKSGLRNPAETVELVYLNGSLTDVPDYVTFSVTATTASRLLLIKPRCGPSLPFDFVSSSGKMCLPDTTERTPHFTCTKSSSAIRHLRSGPRSRLNSRYGDVTTASTLNSCQCFFWS